MRCFNSHVPTKFGTEQRKQDILLNLCMLAAPNSLWPIAHGHNMAWAIFRDLNMDPGSAAKCCQNYLKKDSSSFSNSGWTPNGPCADAQKADFAVSQGVQLTHVQSLFGYHSPPYATDVHDAVVVLGVMSTQATSGDAHPTSSCAALVGIAWAKPILVKATATAARAARPEVPQQATKQSKRGVTHTPQKLHTQAVKSSGDTPPTVNNSAPPGHRRDAPPATTAVPETSRASSGKADHTASSTIFTAAENSGDAHPTDSHAPPATTTAPETIPAYTPGASSSDKADPTASSTILTEAENSSGVPPLTK